MIDFTTTKIYQDYTDTLSHLLQREAFKDLEQQYFVTKMA